MRKLLTIIICTMLMLQGCATVGREMHQADVEQLQKGITTKDQVVKMFGQPDSTFFDKDRRLVFSYFASKCQNTIYNFIPIVNLVHSEMKMKNQILIIAFSKDGIVEEYSFTTPDKTMSYGIMP